MRWDLRRSLQELEQWIQSRSRSRLRQQPRKSARANRERVLKAHWRCLNELAFQDFAGTGAGVAEGVEAAVAVAVCPASAIIPLRAKSMLSPRIRAASCGA